MTKQSTIYNGEIVMSSPPDIEFAAIIDGAHKADAAHGATLSAVYQYGQTASFVVFPVVRSVATFFPLVNCSEK